MVEVSQEAAMLFGQPVEALVSKLLNTFVLVDERRSFIQRMIQAFHSGQGQNWNQQIQPRYGQLFLACLTVYPLHSEQFFWLIHPI